MKTVWVGHCRLRDRRPAGRTGPCSRGHFGYCAAPACLVCHDRHHRTEIGLTAVCGDDCGRPVTAMTHGATRQTAGNRRRRMRL
jgi:hypothetical protein